MKIIFNPDKEVAIHILHMIAENNGYCPCRLIQSEETKCMCKEFREQEKEGYCHCGLYYKTKED